MTSRHIEAIHRWYLELMLELALLGLLKERPMHGYDLRKRLREDAGPFANLSFGSLYPALARLETAGAVQAMVADSPVATPAALPLTGSIGGERAALFARRATTKLGGRSPRARKVYEITRRGEELFEQLLEATDRGGEDGRAFSLKLAFARYLSSPALQRLLEHRRLEVIDRLRRADDSLAAPRRELDRYERSIAEHTRDLLALELSWIESLLAAEQRSVLGETPQAPRTNPPRL